MKFQLHNLRAVIVIAFAFSLSFVAGASASSSPAMPSAGDCSAEVEIWRDIWGVLHVVFHCEGQVACPDDSCEEWDSPNGVGCRCEETVQVYCCSIHIDENNLPVAAGLCSELSCTAAGGCKLVWEWVAGSWWVTASCKPLPL
jgi:hypothetical protein